MEIIFIRFPDVISQESRRKFYDYLLNECLYKFDEGVLIDEPKFKNPRTRQIVSDISFSMLLQKFPKEEDLFIDLTYKLLKSTKWRGTSRESWCLSYNSSSALNATIKSKRRNMNRGQVSKYSVRGSFVGLNNLSNTCYMNSIMQQLFMIPTFRALILKADNPNNNDILHESKFMISALLKLDKQSYTPKNFFNCLTDVSGAKFDPMEQRDADEFFARYLDLLEKGLKGSKESKIIKTLFEGKFSNQLICIDCPHRTERDESFVTLNLQVKNKKEIKESLHNLIENEILQGDNAYSCTDCNKKVSCIKRVCIKQLPNVLVTVLKRFDINYDNMSHNKINSRFEFPTHLNMRDFTVENIEKESLLKEMDSKNLKAEDLTYEQKEILQTSYPDEYYSYNLKGIVIHMGEANSGHYYSYINNRESNNPNDWFEFNDAAVFPFDIDDLSEKAFGGVSDLVYVDENGEKQSTLTENAANAYMLIYERKQMYLWENINNKEELIEVNEFGKLKEKVDVKIDKEEQKQDEVDLLGLNSEEIITVDQIHLEETSEKSSIFNVEVPKEFSNLIQNVNMKEWQLKYIF